MDGPARKVRKSLVLDPWGKDCLDVVLFQEQVNDAKVSHFRDTCSKSLVQILQLDKNTNLVTTADVGSSGAHNLSLASSCDMWFTGELQNVKMWRVESVDHACILALLIQPLELSQSVTIHLKCYRI